jgi:2-hydroxychromene-2-carboxylate isomerase
VALAGALEHEVTDREPPTLQRAQVGAGDHEVATEQPRFDGAPAQERADGREVFGLDEGDVPLAPRFGPAPGRHPPVALEPEAGERFDLPDLHDRSALGRTEADPGDRAGTRQGGDEATDVHHASVGCGAVVPCHLEVLLLTLYFDYVSAPAAVAVLRLQRLADEGASIAFSGIDVLGLEVTIPATLDQLEGVESARASARAVGLELRRPTLRPPTLAAHLVGDLATERGLGAAWRETCLRSYWERGADLGDETVLRELARDTGLADETVRARLADRERRTQLRQRMIVARGRGVGGVPVLEVAGGTFVTADLPDADLRQLATL